MQETANAVLLVPNLQSNGTVLGLLYTRLLPCIDITPKLGKGGTPCTHHRMICYIKNDEPLSARELRSLLGNFPEAGSKSRQSKECKFCICTVDMSLSVLHPGKQEAYQSSRTPSRRSRTLKDSVKQGQ